MRCSTARVKAGATVKMPLADMFWGDRYGVIDRSVRPQLVARHPSARHDAGGNQGGDARRIRRAHAEGLSE